MDTRKKTGTSDKELQERISKVLYDLLSHDDNIKGAIASWLSPTFDDYESKLEETIPSIIVEYCQCLLTHDKAILQNLESHVDDVYAYMPRVPHCQKTKQECLNRVMSKLNLSSPQAIKTLLSNNSNIHCEENTLDDISQQCYQNLSRIDELLLLIDYDKLDKFIESLT